MAIKYGSLPFAAQIAFFRHKSALPTRAWTDIWQANHDHAFVVAGATKMALVEDFQKSIQLAIENGTTLQQFRKDFDQIVAKHGWAYNGSPGWRSKIIYQTNIRSSYQAGRFQQLQKMDYWQYHHSPASANARPQHLAWNGLILPKQDKFWQTHYPMNGWGCKCSVTGLSKQRMKAKGLKASKSPNIELERKTVGTRGPTPRTIDVPKGIDPGFAYAPGRSSWMHGHDLKQAKVSPFPFEQRSDGLFSIIPQQGASDLMQPPRDFPRKKILPPMPKGQDERYARLFLKQFNADVGKPAVFTDISGEAVVLSDAMFKSDMGKWKMGKGTRSAQLNMLAESLKTPDEIWAWTEWHRKEGKAITNRAYVSRYMVGDEQYLSLVVMQRNAGSWDGITVHSSGSADDFNQKVEKNRRGVRLYRRP